MTGYLKVIFVICIACVYFRLVLPFPHVSGDLNYSYSEEVVDQLKVPQIWGIRGAEGLGENATFILWGWPLTFLYSFVTTISSSYNFTVIFLGYVSAVVLSVTAMLKLTEMLGFRPISRYSAALAYTINTYLLLLIDGGQLSLALAYSIMPYVMFFVLTAFKHRNMSTKIKAALSIVALGVFDIRFLYIVLIILAIRFVTMEINSPFNSSFKTLVNWIYVGLIISVIFVLFNFYWLSPSIFSKLPTLPEGYQNTSQADFLSFANVGHALLWLQPHWYKNIFGNTTALISSFFIFPFLVFLAPLLSTRSKELKFWLLTAVVGIFLVKGNNPPFGELYIWLFIHIPGFSIFRDATKFFTILSLSYSVLIGFTFDGIMAKFDKKRQQLIFILWCILLLIIFRPVWLGKMTGTFSQPAYVNDYLKLAADLEEDPEFGRILWIPTKTSLGYSTPTHPSLEALRLVSKRPFEIGIVGTYELFNFLRESSFIGELLDISGIKYIAYPFPDERRENLKQDNIDYYYAFLDQLSSKDWVKKIVSEPPVSVLELKDPEDHFFLTNNTLVVLGSDDIYNKLISIPDFRLANNAVIFLEDTIDVINRLKELPSYTTIINAKGANDLAILESNSQNRFIFPATFLENSPNESGWWKRDSGDFLWFRNFLQEKYTIDNQDFDYGGGWAISEGENELQIESDKFCNECILFARVMRSPKGGEIEFYQKDHKLGSVFTGPTGIEPVMKKITGYGDTSDQNLEYFKADFVWVEVGKLDSGNSELSITLKTEGDINVVNALLSVPQTSWESYLYKAKEIMKTVQSSSYGEYAVAGQDVIANSANPAIVTYNRLSSTYYKVRISNLTKPTVLAFSETYDPLWRIKPAGGTGGVRSSIPLYSLINGFVVDSNGEYDVFFEPQKYVDSGFKVSLLTLGLILLVLAVPRRR